MTLKDNGDGTFSVIAPYRFDQPSNDYERGFIDGMAKQTHSAVQKFVEGLNDDIKLQNHFKELTDEEIVAIYKEVFGWDVKTSDKNWIGLARALIKASKK